MLVLSRKRQQSVVVGGADGSERVLRVTVLEISRGTVRLGFEVDREIPAHRLEVWERLEVGEGLGKDRPNSPRASPEAPVA